METTSKAYQSVAISAADFSCAPHKMGEARQMAPLHFARVACLVPRNIDAGDIYLRASMPACLYRVTRCRRSSDSETSPSSIVVVGSGITAFRPSEKSVITSR